jgi:UDP-N-acetyl-D-glucosamine dehydrogenase
MVATTGKDLISKFESRQATVSVIGLGYVGLPLAVAFADAGFCTIGIDLNQAKVDSVNRGESYIQGIPSSSSGRLSNSGKSNIDDAGSLTATTDYDALNEVDAVIVCVPTPLSKTRDPDVSYIVSAANEIASRLHRGVLIVLESTTYPGTTEEIILPRMQNAPIGDESDSPLKAGVDFYLAFSPERIDPGRTDFTVLNTPKVMGGVTQSCSDAAVALYGSALERIVPVSSPKVAETVKLLENTFRATNIALVNEFAIMCDYLDVDVWEVIEAAKTKPFGYMPFYPGPGLGGHCIPVDPQYLAWKLRTLNYDARFIQLAEEINFGMPSYVLNKIGDALNDRKKPLNGSKVLVLGVAYKPDVEDLRESPALDLIHLLIGKGADVQYHDPYVPSFEVEGLAMTSINLSDQSLQNSDCVVITTNHSSYDWQWITEHSRLIVDTRNATSGLDSTDATIVKL